MARARILLTGGSGMVGQNILEHPDAGHWDFIAPNSRELNLTDYTASLHFIQSVQPDAVVHCAGRVGGIHANMAHPVDFLVTNLDLGRNIVMAARAAGVTQLLNLASSCMYPRNAPNPLAEDLILQGELEPTNEGYALAKIVTTRLCQYVQRETPGLVYKTLIPCNLFGRHDKFAPRHSHLLPAIIHKMHHAKQRGLPTVEIWGDGTARREFMYAGDLADATLRALQDLKQIPDLMNIGLGTDYSIQDYYACAAQVVGWSGEFVYDTTKPVGMQRKLVAIDRQRRWGWMPQTSLREGIEKAYRYYLQEYKE